MKKTILASLLLGTSAVPCYAQDLAATPPQGAADTNSEDIVVTASKREEKSNAVPMSINALSANEISKLNVKDVSDLTRAVPGFQASDSGYGQPIYFLRGVGFYDTSLQSKPTVSVYMDEVPFVLSPLSLGAAFDIQRVEVLKGPQGTLYGQNATGGAINFIAQKPTDEFHVGADASYGRFNNVNVSGFVSGPLSSTLSARLALRHERADDWQKSYTRDATNGDKDFTQGRFILDWHPTDNFKAVLTLNAFRDRGETQDPQFRAPFLQTSTTTLAPGFVNYPVAPNNARATDFTDGISTKKHNDFRQASLRIDYDLTPEVTLTSLTSYSHYKQNYGLDADGTTFKIFHYLIDGEVNAVTQELRLAGQVGTQGHWVAGLSYEHDHTEERQNGFGTDASSVHAFERFGVGIIDQSPSISDTKFESKAAFVNLDYDLTSTITAHAGIRYTRTDIDFSGCLLSAGSGALGYGLSTIFRIVPRIEIGQCATLSGTTPGLVNRSLPESNVAWRGGLDWKPRDGVLLYANVSRGFKSGGFPNLGASNASQYTPVVQEEVTAYELGYKISPIRRLQINGALFYYDYTNKQLKGRIVVPIFGALNAIVNVPKSYILGAEAQATWRPDNHLRISAGGTYLKSKVDGTFFNYTYAGALTDFDGSRFPYTPKWQANADAEYGWELGGSTRMFIGGTMTYRSGTSSQFIPTPVLAIAPYTLFDARLGIETNDGRWRAMLSGQNLTNKYYWTQAIRTGDAITRYSGMPVTYSLGITYRY